MSAAVKKEERNHDIVLTWEDSSDPASFLKAVEANYPNKQGALFVCIRPADMGGVIVPSLCTQRRFKFYGEHGPYLVFYHWGDTSRPDGVLKPGSCTESVGAILYCADTKTCWLENGALAQRSCPITMSPLRTAVLLLSCIAKDEQMTKCHYMGGWQFDDSYDSLGASRRTNHTVYGFTIAKESKDVKFVSGGAWVCPGAILRDGKLSEVDSNGDPRSQQITYQGHSYNLDAVRRCASYAQRVASNVATNITSALAGDVVQIIQI